MGKHTVVIPLLQRGTMDAKAPEQPLFQSRGADGKTVMLSVTPDGASWTLRRDGDVVADGTGETVSIDAAVRKFRALVKPAEQGKR